MAKMRLYYSPSSPYARKVRVLALETKLDKKIDMINVALTPVQPNADVDKHNPIGKIPALSVKGKITLGTITIGCALGYLDFRFGSHDWRAKRPKLAKWFTTFSKLPSMK